MSPNIYYDPATFCMPTSVPRQWRLRWTTERGGTVYQHDILFPDALQGLISGGYVTLPEVYEQLFGLVSWAERKRLGF